MAAETQFYFLRNELTEMFQKLVSEGYGFLPTGPLKKPNFETLDDIGELVKNLQGIEKLASTHPEYTTLQIPFSKSDNIHMGLVYDLSENDGGQALVILVGANVPYFWKPIEEIDIVSFNIGYVSWFDDLKGGFVPPFSETKEHYQLLSKRCKKMGQKYSPLTGEASCWISKSLVSLLKQEKLIEVTES